MTSPEQQHIQTPEKHKPRIDLPTEHVERSGRESKEYSPQNPESRKAETVHALEEAKKEALAGPEQGGTEKEKNHQDTSPKPAGEQQRERVYKQTLTQMQAELSPAQRTFSKIIHQPTVEKVSDIVGSTIARPNAILSGSVCAFLLVLGVYVNARYMGYALSGFETIAAFLLGWIVGVLFDVIRLAFRGKR